MIVTRQIEIRKKPAVSAPRAYRLERGVTLATAASLSGLSTYRVSIIERFSERARPGELERLRAAVDKAAEIYGTAARAAEAQP